MRSKRKEVDSAFECLIITGRVAVLTEFTILPDFWLNREFFNL